jgi:hypothetical protein
MSWTFISISPALVACAVATSTSFLFDAFLSERNLSESAIWVSTVSRLDSFCWRAPSSSSRASRSALAVAIRAFLSASWIFGWPRALR